jgi:NAD(P)-dependent dehydrogenase (short-subunit alcohol dehydrogenase family)
MATHTKLASLKGKVAIITGAGGGLGREYALALASHGVKVVVNDYGGSLGGQRGTSSRAQSAVDEIVAAGGEAIADGHDISNKQEVESMVSDAVAIFGTVHILINNAGIPGQFGAGNGKVSVDPALFLRTIEIAALGTILCTSAVYPIMDKQKYGRIINTSSDTIFGMGSGGDGGYAASKGAVFAMTRDLGRFSTNDGIKINGVLPSASSRMSALDPVTKKICEEHFSAAKVAQFVCALAAEECPVSGELFSVGAGRAARTTLATVPGSNQERVEGYLENFDKVMGVGQSLYVPKDCLDQVSYTVRNATGSELKIPR